MTLPGSLQKTRNLLDSLMDSSDRELGELLGGVPVPLARGILPVIPAMLPDTDRELDEQIDGFHQLLEQLRSDPEDADAA